MNKLGATSASTACDIRRWLCLSHSMENTVSTCPLRLKGPVTKIKAGIALVRWWYCPENPLKSSSTDCRTSISPSSLPSPSQRTRGRLRGESHLVVDHALREIIDYGVLLIAGPVPCSAKVVQARHRGRSPLKPRRHASASAPLAVSVRWSKDAPTRPLKLKTRISPEDRLVSALSTSEARQESPRTGAQSA